MFSAHQGPATQVSVVIPHFGDPQLPGRLVKRLGGQGVREIIVVDDASPTPLGTLAGAAVVRRDVNGGFGAAVNTGAGMACGDLLLVLNSDTEPQPGMIARLVAAAAPLQPCVVSPRIVSRGERQDTARRFPRAWHPAVESVGVFGRYADRPIVQRAIGVLPTPAGGQPLRADWVAGVALLIPRAEFLSVGGFDERFFMYVEEADLQRRLRERGVPAYLITSVELEHAGEGSSDAGLRPQWLARSRATYAYKWGYLGRQRLALAAAIPVDLVGELVLQLTGRGGQPLRSTARLIAGVRARPVRTLRTDPHRVSEARSTLRGLVAAAGKTAALAGRRLGQRAR